MARTLTWIKTSLFLLLGFTTVAAFTAKPAGRLATSPIISSSSQQQAPSRHQRPVTGTQLRAWNNNEDPAAVQEAARLKILKDRRKSIRGCLKSAEAVRTLRHLQGWVPELDEEGKPLQSDGKFAVTLTAFGVAAGAILLRVGGRAALVSAIGLDFATENPELKANLDHILDVSDTMDPATKAALFTAAWTAVKVLCFDAGGVALALSAGILFGGVLQGALMSAAGATFGSCVAFSLAKLDTPVRGKALELLEEYPSLRGIEKVVARDGLKAILTLRLAPILPIPIGMYNYVYGVTNVAVTDFAGGIFLGSLKPYLLDSYLGYFGKGIVDGTSDASGAQDVILLGVLGFSVLIGVFASQLAAETWDSVLEEVEAEKQAKEGVDGAVEDPDDGIKSELFGVEFPEFLVNVQRALRDANERVNDMVLVEHNAKLWNMTDADGGIPANRNPALALTSPEVSGANQGLKIGASVCDGLMLSPVLFSAWTKYADPLYDEEEDEQLKDHAALRSASPAVDDSDDTLKQNLLGRVDKLRVKAKQRLELLDEQLQNESERS